MVNGGESFWSCVYAPFMARDLTRDDLRTIVRKGLERTSGNYKVMVELFNMPADDYKRFLGFLRKYQCHMPFQQFRSAATSRDAGRAGIRPPVGWPRPPERPRAWGVRPRQTFWPSENSIGIFHLTVEAAQESQRFSLQVGDRAASAALRSRPA